MKKILSFLLACLMMVSVFTYPASAAVPETGQPRWSNTYDVFLAHAADGTTAHCSVDITIHSGATMTNVEIWLIDMETSDIVHRWIDPEMSVNSLGTHSFYGTVEDIIPGNCYRLAFQCEVWNNGICDYISTQCDAIY